MMRLTVYFENEQNYKVGEKARKHLFTEPDSTVELIKIRLGKTHKIQVKTPNSRFEKSPQEISSYLPANSEFSLSPYKLSLSLYRFRLSLCKLSLSLEF